MRVVTAVVGAGPAGLLFAFLARALAASAGRDLPLYLHDKRDSYVRTHRLRIAPEPYRDIARAVDHPGYAAFLTFLEHNAFKPAVDELERQLLSLVTDVGVHKERLRIGHGDGATSLAELRAQLEREKRLGPDDFLSIVAADSVHSETRELVRGSARPTQKLHQLVARLKVEGAELPDELPIIEQLRLSKLIASVMDYRKHPAGHAEIDLFLGPSEHRSLEALAANPKAPVELDPATLASLRAPLFCKIVDYLRHDFAPGGSLVTLWSTFVLEHKHMHPVSFAVPAINAHVSLVGDAAISLPFFRGMACLAESAFALAEAHVAAASPSGNRAALAARYQERIDGILNRELAIVEARARLIRGAREFVRLSELVPFPVQSWFLSVPDESTPAWRLTPGVVLNLAIATAGAAAALGAPLLAPALAGDWPRRLVIGGALYALSAALQLAGGLLYRHTQNLDASAASAAKRLWTVQMLVLILGGVLISVSSLWRTSGLQLLPALSWLLFGASFVAGMLIYEALERRWWSRAEL